MKYLKKIFKGLVFIFGLTEEVKKNMVDMGFVDFGGQGRNKYGK